MTGYETTKPTFIHFVAYVLIAFAVCYWSAGGFKITNRVDAYRMAEDMPRKIQLVENAVISDIDATGEDWLRVKENPGIIRSYEKLSADLDSIQVLNSELKYLILKLKEKEKRSK